MARSGLVFAWLVIACAAGLLTVESWLPGQVLLPLLPDDLPVWQEGRDPAELIRHPAANLNMSDVDHLLVTGLAVTRAALERGELPSWDPSQALGLPHVAQVHYSVFYPPAWLPLIFGVAGLGVLAWLHLVLAGGGMLLYLRALKRRRTAALTGALAFALSAWMVARVQSFPAVGAAVWLPWVLWGLERGAHYGTARSYLAASVALALSFLAGFPQVSLLVAGTALALELARLFSRPRAVLTCLPMSLAALGLAALLAAGQLLPTFQYLSNDSARTEQTAEQVASQGLEPALLAQLLAPDYYSDAGLAGLHPMALLSLREATLPAALNRAETSMGISVMGLLLAVIAMIFGRTATTRAWTVLVLAIFALLLNPSLLELAARWIPGMGVGNPKRLLLVACGLSVVLMVGVPSVETPEDVDAWAMELAQIHKLEDATPQAVYEGVPLPRASFESAARRAFQSSLIALAASLAAVILFRPRSAAATQQGWTSLARRAPEALMLVLATELIISGLPLLRAAPSAGLRDAQWLPAPPVVDQIQQVLGPRLVPPRLVRHTNDPAWLRPNLPVLFDLLDLQAYAPMVPKRTQALLASFAPGTAISGSHVGGLADAVELSHPLVDLLGVELVLSADDTLEVEGMQEIARTGRLRVLRNTDAYPHAWCVSASVISPGVDGLPGDWVADPAFDGRSMVALEAPLPPGPMPAGEVPPPDGPDLGSRIVRVQNWRPGRVDLHVGPGPAGAVILSESFHEGWTATVDGQPAPVVVADHALLAVSLGQGGTARVLLQHSQPSLQTGGALGLGALLVAAALVWWHDRRRVSPMPEQEST